MKSYGVTIQMKATEHYFPVVLFIMLYKAVLTFESVDEILWCDHSNESNWAVLSCGTIFESVDEIRKFDHSNASVPMVLDIMLYNVGLPFESVDEILKCGYVKKRRRQYFQS